MMNRTQFAQSTLLGLAVGDALGTTVEFRLRDSFPVHTEMTGGGAFAVKPGEWTDDTAMALCLAQSLLECKGFDPRDQLAKYLNWLNAGYMACQNKCIDIGNATRQALALYANTNIDFAGSDNPFSSGNGGIMRLAPAISAAPDRETALEYAVNSSRTTHASGDCLDAAEMLGAILWELREGKDLKTLMEQLPDTEERGMAIGRIKKGFFRTANRNDIASTGYVIDTLEAALWSCYHARSFEDALVKAVNLADDADTVAAVTGQIAGAAWGKDAIPERWLEPLAWQDTITHMAGGLANLGT